MKFLHSIINRGIKQSQRNLLGQCFTKLALGKDRGMDFTCWTVKYVASSAASSG